MAISARDDCHDDQCPVIAAYTDSPTRYGGTEGAEAVTAALAAVRVDAHLPPLVREAASVMPAHILTIWAIAGRCAVQWPDRKFRVGHDRSSSSDYISLYDRHGERVELRRATLTTVDIVVPDISIGAPFTVSQAFDRVMTHLTRYYAP